MRLGPARKNTHGFTVIELSVVIALLGILAVSALPNFIDVATSAYVAARDGTAASIQTGIRLQQLQDIVTNGPPGAFPASLDGLANNTTCGAATLCFTTVLLQGVTDARWHKVNDRRYRYTTPTTTTTYVYSSVNGTFIEQ